MNFLIVWLSLLALSNSMFSKSNILYFVVFPTLTTGYNKQNVHPISVLFCDLVFKN